MYENCVTPERVYAHRKISAAVKSLPFVVTCQKEVNLESPAANAGLVHERLPGQSPEKKGSISPSRRQEIKREVKMDNAETPDASLDYECNIKVFTLNCWGLKGISDKRSERITAIANYLRQSVYDIVLLQEVNTHHRDKHFLLETLKHFYSAGT